MGADQNIDWRSAAAHLLDWWRLAGVDATVEDQVRDWRAAPPPAATPLPATPIGSPGPAALPTTLLDLEAWRIGAEAPEKQWGKPATAAEGNAASGLMVLVDQPDERDGGLLGGAPGRLFDNMLRAIGRDRASIYLTAVCLCRTPGGRLLPETTDRLYEVARHHVALADARRVLVLGNAAARALLGADVTAVRGGLRGINQADGNTAGPQVVASFHPRHLLERPHLKAEAWKDLRLLMGGFDA